jgi:predicted  nucleic acid-binding Zn-ribbon protein
MLADLERLIRLQKLESQMEDARRTIAAHPTRVQDADARLDAAKRALDTARQRLKENHDARRALEKDAAVFQTRLSKFKDQLSEVKTNREYQAMQKEIEVAQTELRAVEDKELERMVEADTLAADVKKAETALVTGQKEIEAEKKRLTQELAATEQSLKDASSERSALVRELDPRLVALFEQVSKARKGIAICPARDGLCSLCHVRLRPHVFQQVRHNDSIIQCDSCQRILYYIPPPAAAQPNPTAATS